MASGHEVLRHRLIPGDLRLEDWPELGGIQGHVHGQLEVHLALIDGIVEIDCRGQGGALLGRQLRQAATAAHGADDFGRALRARMGI